jgi:hypothetical protein
MRADDLVSILYIKHFEYSPRKRLNIGKIVKLVHGV